MAAHIAASTTGLLVFASEVAKARTPLEVLELLDRRIAQPHGLRAYGVWQTPLLVNASDGANGYTAGRNVFVHASVPQSFWPEFWPMLRERGPSVMARYARQHPDVFTFTE